MRFVAGRFKNIAPQTTSAPMITIFITIRELCTVLPARTPRQLISVRIPSASAARAPLEMGMCVSSTKIFSKRDGYRGHAAGLNYQKQRPSIKKSDAGVIGLANVGILAADGGHARSKLSVNKCAGHGDESTENPRTKN